MKTILFYLFLVGITSFSFSQDKASMEKACLDKFNDLNLPFSMKNSKNGIESPEQATLSAKEQTEILGTGAYNEEGFGMHMGAVGKVEISKGIYLLIYNTTVVPVPAHMDEYSFAIYKIGSYKMTSITDIAYTRGGPGIDEGVLTSSVSKEGNNIKVESKLEFRKAIETDDGPDYGPVKVSSSFVLIDSNGNLKKSQSLLKM